MICPKCGNILQEVSCVECGLDIKRDSILALETFDFSLPKKEVLNPESKRPHHKKTNKQDEGDRLTYAYCIRGKLYTYEEAKKMNRFDPSRGDKIEIRYVTPFGQITSKIPSEKEIEKFLRRKRQT